MKKQEIRIKSKMIDYGDGLGVDQTETIIFENEAERQKKEDEVLEDFYQYHCYSWGNDVPMDLEIKKSKIKGL